MKNKLLFLLLTVVFGLNTFAQTTNPWSITSDRELNILTNIKDRSFPISTQYFKLDLQKMTNTLMGAADILKKDHDVIITIPNVNGELESFKIWEFSNFAPELQAQFPQIRSYRGKGITDSNANLSISLSPNGLQTMVIRADKTAEFIEPYTTDGLYYALSNKTERKANNSPFICLTKNEQQLASDISLSNREIQNSSLSNAQSLKTFRLALSCTGEYGQYFGGTKEGALAGMNNTLTRVNGIYENEIAVHLNLIANNNVLIYVDPNTDPYDPASTGAKPDGTTGLAPWNKQLQTNLTQTIGSDAYDIGHLFGASGGGGNAGCVGCVCVNPTGTSYTSSSQFKGMGFTSPADARPEGDNFDVDYVSHEMGHQLGANHTFSHSFENNPANVQVEPGSGSTIMGYAGITSQDIQKHSDPYFNYESLKQIQNNLASKTCQTNIPIANNPPTINAGANYTIPAGTAFMLTGSGSDVDGDTIFYNWEQIDSSTSTTAGTSSFASPIKTVGPNFRSFTPTTSPVRYFPQLYTILTSTDITPTANTYEALTASGTSRTLNFALTGRDNHPGGGQTNTGTMVVTVDGTKGPFYVTSFNSNPINWSQGTSQTITWSVGNSNTLSGATNVDILLSTDNGLTYTTVLASNVPNDGSETITVPHFQATNCRFMIKPTGNIFFAINRQTFSIGTTVATNCTNSYNTDITNIPSGADNFGSSIITNSNPGFVTSVTASINVSHSNFGDLSFSLVSPKGTEIRLITNNCFNTSANSTTIKFSDSGNIISCTSNDFSKAMTVLSQEPLYKLIGENAQGDWTLKFNDDTINNSGKINSWTLSLCSQDQEISLGTDEFKLNNLSLYPNPTNDIVNISVPDESNLPENLIVYNNVGQMVYNAKINDIRDLSFSTNRFASGVYFVKVSKADASTTLKFIKN